MTLERIVLRLLRMAMRGNLGKMARGETSAKPPDRSQLARQAMRILRRVGRM